MAVTATTQCWAAGTRVPKTLPERNAVDENGGDEEGHGEQSRLGGRGR